MKRSSTCAAALAIAVAMLASSCASSGGSTASAFPTGKFRNGETVAVFNTDGTFVGTTTKGQDWVKGTYRIQGSEISMVDTWEGDSLKGDMGKSCLGIHGRYTWSLSGDVLTANAIDDACEGRRKGTSGVPWTRMQ